MSTLLSPLALLLITKIAVTLPLIAAPFLLMPKARIDRLSGFDGSLALYRLYGAAILALLVGYAGGLVMVVGGAFPWGVAAMGLVSNAGAAIVLIATGAARKKPALTGFFTFIAIGLAAAAAAPQAAVTPL